MQTFWKIPSKVSDINSQVYLKVSKIDVIRLDNFTMSVEVETRKKLTIGYGVS